MGGILGMSGALAKECPWMGCILSVSGALTKKCPWMGGILGMSGTLTKECLWVELHLSAVGRVRLGYLHRVVFHIMDNGIKYLPISTFKPSYY